LKNIQLVIHKPAYICYGRKTNNFIMERWWCCL